MAVALGGLALVVASRGGAPEQDAVTVDDSRDPAVITGTASPSDDGSWPGLTEGVRQAAGTESIRLLDFGEIDQQGDTCDAGIEGRLPSTIAVTEGGSGLLDRDMVTRLAVDGKVAYGDLDGDGGDEAVVHTVCEFGANGATDTVQVWDLDSGAPQLAASMGEPPAAVSGPFPSAVQSVAVEGDEVVVTWTRYDEDDPHCCASQLVTVRYDLVAGELRANSAPVTTPAG